MLAAAASITVGWLAAAKLVFSEPPGSAKLLGAAAAASFGLRRGWRKVERQLRGQRAGQTETRGRQSHELIWQHARIEDSSVHLLGWSQRKTQKEADIKGSGLSRIEGFCIREPIGFLQLFRSHGSELELRKLKTCLGFLATCMCSKVFGSVPTEIWGQISKGKAWASFGHDCTNAWLKEMGARALYRKVF